MKINLIISSGICLPPNFPKDVLHISVITTMIYV